MTRRTIAFLFLAAILIASLPAMAGHRHNDNHNSHLEDVDIDFEDDGTLVLDPDGYRGESLTISKDLVLHVNGERVKLDDSEKMLVADYYENGMKVVLTAEAMGRAGAKMGVRGVALAVNTIAKVAKLLDADYDSDDLERDVEAEAESMEEAGEELEKQGEILSGRVDEMGRIAKKMRSRIPEVAELDWFD